MKSYCSLLTRIEFKERTYSGWQLLKTDDTIDNKNRRHQHVEISIRAGCSKKSVRILFYFQVFLFRDNAVKGFKRIWPALVVIAECDIWRRRNQLITFRYVLSALLWWFYTWTYYWNCSKKGHTWEMLPESSKSPSVVLRILISLHRTEMCSKRHGRGRLFSMKATESKYIVLASRKYRRTKASQVANQFLAATVNWLIRNAVARRF